MSVELASRGKETPGISIKFILYSDSPVESKVHARRGLIVDSIGAFFVAFLSSLDRTHIHENESSNADTAAPKDLSTHPVFQL